MIIQVRGTSGSGKTTAVREFMKTLDWTPVYKEGRKKPLYYRCGSVALLGHYEGTACGGCDTIGSARAVFDLIGSVLNQGVEHVVCEGLLLSEDTKWTLQLSEVRCIFLNTPLKVCLQRIQERRRQAGNDTPLNPSNTTNRVSVIERARVKLKRGGVTCVRCSTSIASKTITRWLRLHAQQE